MHATQNENKKYTGGIIFLFIIFSLPILKYVGYKGQKNTQWGVIGKSSLLRNNEYYLLTLLYPGGRL